MRYRPILSGSHCDVSGDGAPAATAVASLLSAEVRSSPGALASSSSFKRDSRFRAANTSGGDLVAENRASEQSRQTYLSSTGQALLEDWRLTSATAYQWPVFRKPARDSPREPG